MSKDVKTTASPHSHRSQLKQGRHRLEAFFSPRNVAVIGATETENAVGRTVLWNLMSSPFGGAVYPVNPKRQSVLGIKAYASVGEVPDQVDLAVIVTPAGAVPGLVGECADAGVNSVIVISAGFKELGEPGLELERRVLEEARRGGMRIIGPNCLGVMSPLSGVNATFAAGMARPGSVAFLSQSGALGTAVLDWSFREQVGFSAFASIGSMLDVNWGDLIDYLGNDPRTQSIVIYMESIGDARSFLSAAREVAMSKPIIVIKAGRTAQAAQAAASHTGALTGSDEVLDAAFRRVGVLRVDTIADVFNMAEILGKQPRPKGPHLTILTNAGGPGVLATDTLICSGGQLTELSDTAMKELNDFLPPHWSRNNPVDVLGDAGADRYAKALEICARDESADGMLVILTPQSMTDPTQTAEQLKSYARIEGKPVLASWMGGPIVEAGNDILSRAGIPTFDHPDEAARAFCYMWQYSYNLNGLYETPVLRNDIDANGALDRERATEIISQARDASRTLLTEYESKALLECYGITTVATRVVKSADEAVAQAEELGYPVVLKLHSFTITHKTDVGGVKLNLADEAAVREAYGAIEKSVGERASAEAFDGVTVQPMVELDGYELIIGSSLDAQFGPVLLFGSGGQLVEVYKDRALGLPPLNATLARRMMEQTKIYEALKGVRGRKAVDLEALEQLMVGFSQLVAEQKAIAEIDINPLLASGERLLALDARVVLHGPDVDLESLPRPAVRPYPTRYVGSIHAKGVGEVVLRPIRPEDEPAMVRFHEQLSERTVRLRYFHALNLSDRVAHERLVRVCFSDYDRDIVLVAAHRDAESGEEEILGVGRLSKERWSNEGEIAILVADRWQKLGIGSALGRLITEVGRGEKLDTVSARMLRDNVAMFKLCESLGYTPVADPDDETVLAVFTY